MAKPIKETPVLNGVDAKNFIHKKAQNELDKTSLLERERIKVNYSRLNALAKFK